MVDNFASLFLLYVMLYEITISCQDHLGLDVGKHEQMQINKPGASAIFSTRGGCCGQAMFMADSCYRRQTRVLQTKTSRRWRPASTTCGRAQTRRASGTNCKRTGGSAQTTRRKRGGPSARGLPCFCRAFTFRVCNVCLCTCMLLFHHIVHAHKINLHFICSNLFQKHG